MRCPSPNLTTKLYLFLHNVFMYRKVHHIIYFCFINKKKTQGSSSWCHGSAVRCKANVRCGSTASVLFPPFKTWKRALCAIFGHREICMSLVLVLSSDWSSFEIFPFNSLIWCSRHKRFLIFWWSVSAQVLTLQNNEV